MTCSSKSTIRTEALRADSVANRQKSSLSVRLAKVEVNTTNPLSAKSLICLGYGTSIQSLFRENTKTGTCGQNAKRFPSMQLVDVIVLNVTLTVFYPTSKSIYGGFSTIASGRCESAVEARFIGTLKIETNDRSFDKSFI